MIQEKRIVGWFINKIKMVTGILISADDEGVFVQTDENDPRTRIKVKWSDEPRIVHREEFLYGTKDIE